MAMSDSPESDRALVKYADGLVGELRENVQVALRDFDADAIHDARVATRRLSAALDLLEPVLSAGPRKKFERVLKKLRSRLGPLRDLDVMLEHLHELSNKTTGDPSPEVITSQPVAQAPVPPSSRPLTKAIAWLTDRLEDQRAEKRKKSTKKRTIPRIMESLASWWSLHGELAEADEAAGTLLADSIHLQLDAFAEQAANPRGEKSEKGEKGVKNGAGQHDPHALRKAGKALRYTLELAGATAHPLPAGTIRAFKKLQDALGLWHDYAVLADAAMQASMDELLAYHDSQLQLQVLDLARDAVRRSARALTRFDRLWHRRGEPLLASIREAFPLTKDVTPDQATDSKDSPPASLEETEENGVIATDENQMDTDKNQITQ
jgi:CHAD domain-containing protein